MDIQQLDFSAKKWLNSIFAVGVSLVIIINLISCYQFYRFMNANNLVIHTYKVLQSSNNILINLIETESRVRGFVITGDNNFLSPFKENINDVYTSFNTTKELMKDNAAQQEKLNNLFSLLQQRIKYFQKTIAIKRNNLANTREGLSTIHEAQSISNQIHAVTNQITDTELMLLQDRTNDTKSTLVTTILVILGVGTINVALLIGIIILFNRQLNLKIKTESDLNNYQNLIKSIINGSNDFIAAIDIHHKVMLFNTAFAQEVKRLYRKKVYVGMHLNEFFGHNADDEQNAFKVWNRALAGEEFTVVGTFGDPEFERNQYEITFSSIYSDNGKLIGAAQIARDVSKKIEAQNQILDAKNEAELRLKELHQHDTEMMTINKMGQILQSTVTLEETLLLIERYCRQLLSRYAGVIYVINSSKNYLEMVATWNTTAQTEKLFSPENCWGLRQGTLFSYIEEEVNTPCKHINSTHPHPYLCFPLLAQHDVIGLLYLEFASEENQKIESKKEYFTQQEKLIHLIASHISLALANIKLREKLKSRSIRDQLTGLYNRMYLDESLERDLQRAKRDGKSIALVMMDLDHFKNVNDTYGHEAGDYVLQEIGKILSNSVRKSDIAARFGGEEFLLMLYDTNLEDAKNRVEKILESVRKTQIQYQGEILKVTASFGISIFPEHSENIEVLLQQADQALYQSKKTGRNKITLCVT